MDARQRSWWAWGREDQQLTTKERSKLATQLTSRFGGTELTQSEPVPFPKIQMPDVRLSIPSSLERLCTQDSYERALHAHGRGYKDTVRGFYGDFSDAPDIVAYPNGEQDLVSLLEWAGEQRCAVVPYGGGTSVVGGVDGGGEWARAYSGVLSIDMARFDQVLEIDSVSRAARIQAGVLGPSLENQLRPHGYTLRHFMQSFEFSTLGGWLATRSAGHYASGGTHIDDFVESIRLISPTGSGTSRRLPASGAGPSPDRLLLGSEGTLGVITEAWMRIQDRPRFKSSAGVHFATYEQGVSATRAVVQSGLTPTNCRLLDAQESGTVLSGPGPAGALLVLGFESAAHPVDAPMADAVEICLDHGGSIPDGVESETRAASASAPQTSGGAVHAWREAFIRGPYLLSSMVRLGIYSETFETACTWSAFADLHAAVMNTAAEVLNRTSHGKGRVTCRFTHVYPDGCAPYFTVQAPIGHGNELAVHDEMKAAISETIASHCGTITHHHAIGREHRPWYERQHPAWFADSLRAAKAVVDPQSLLVPGVLMSSA